MAFEGVPRWGVGSEDTWTSWLRWSTALSLLLHSFSPLSGSRGELCVNSQSIFPSRKHDIYSESCSREVMSRVIKPVRWDDAWQTSSNFADLFVFFLEAVYELSQLVKPRHASLCVSHLCMLFSSKDLLSPKDILLWKSYYNESEFIHDADNDNLSKVTQKFHLF